MNQGNLSRININELTSKLNSKKELYQWLVQDCQAYLPPMHSTNVYFFKAVMRGTKEYIKRDKVMVAAVPQIEGLTVEGILDQFRDNAQLLKYLPDERDWVHIDRKWVCDILYTLNKDNFQRIINAAMEHRRDKLEQSRNQLVELRPEFAQALSSCMNFSTHNGRSATLMKASSKRKRTRSELEEVKEEESDLKDDKQSYLQQVKKLRLEKAQLEARLDEMVMMNSAPSGFASAQSSKMAHPTFEI